MEVKGKIILKLPKMSGVSKAGNSWSKQEYVLETQEAYPRKIHFNFFGERADKYPLEVGQVVNLSFDIDSHEFNGRWFTSISGWKAEKVEDNAPQAQAAPQYPQYSATAPQPPVDFGGGGSNDDLPF